MRKQVPQHLQNKDPSDEDLEALDNWVDENRPVWCMPTLGILDAAQSLAAAMGECSWSTAPDDGDVK